MPNVRTVVLRRVRGPRPRPVPSAGGGDPGDGVGFEDSLFLTTTDDTIPNLMADAEAEGIMSSQSGNWSDPDTWVGGVVPSTGDKVGIYANHTVTYDVESADVLYGIGISGVLKFKEDVDTLLWVRHLTVYDTGELRIGTVAAPIQDDVVAEVVFPDVALDPADPAEYNHGLVVVGGKIRSKATTTTHVVRLAVDPEATDTALTFASAVTGWKVGNKLYLPDTRQLLGSQRGASHSPQWEYPVIATVAVDGLSVTLTAPLDFDHFGARDGDGVQDIFVPIANLTRHNIIIRSENPDGVRGHTLFTGLRADIDVRDVEFRSLGRTRSPTLLDNAVTGTAAGGTTTSITLPPYSAVDDIFNGRRIRTMSGTGSGQWAVISDYVGATKVATLDRTWAVAPDATTVFLLSATNQIGRYATHIHHVVGPAGLPAETPQWLLDGCVVTDESTSHDDRWAFTVHDSHWGTVRNCVAHHYCGWGFGCEMGNETEVLFENNFACRIRNNGVGAARIDSGDERGIHGRGFYIPGPRIRLRNNIACNIGDFEFSQYDYGFSFLNHSTFFSVLGCPAAKGSTEPSGFSPGFEALLEFDGNETFGQLRGMEWWRICAGSSGELNSSDPSTIDNLTIWHVCELGVFGYETSALTVDHFKFRGDRGSSEWIEVIGYSDYRQHNTTVTNADIQNGLFAMHLPPSHMTGTFTFSNSYIRCKVGLLCTETWYNGGSATDLSYTRHYSIENCEFVAPSGFWAGEPLTTIFMDLPDTAASISRTTNLVNPIIVEFIDYQGVVGDNFRAWFNEQAPTVITPESVDHPGNPGVWWLVHGASVSGRTNAVNFADDGRCYCGELRPTVGLESRTGIPNQVTVTP